MEVPRLRVELELQLQAYTTATATATRDLSRICDLHLSSWQCRILNPLIEARVRTHNLRGPSWIYYPLNHDGNSQLEIETQFKIKNP